MTRKIAGFLTIIALAFSYGGFAIAQTLDTGTPATDTTTVEETVTPPADTTGPAFISVATASAEETEVTVVWTTDELAYGFLEYGETTSYGHSTEKSASAELDHTVAVTNLTAGTVYHYRIVAEDQSGNISYSKDRTFETALEVIAIDNVPPEITEVSVTNITSSGGTISWVTNELAQGKVEYGKTANYGASSPLATDYATEHSVTLSGLDPNIEYHYRVLVQDESGNEAVSPDEVFITDPLPPPIEEQESSTATSTPEKNITEEIATTTSQTSTTTETTANTATSTSGTGTTSGTSTTTTITAFAISHVETETVATTTATIIWKTNEPATSQIFYGVGENYASSSALFTTKVTAHKVKLIGLKSGINYFYKVVSANASGKTIEKSGFEFSTLFKQKITLPAPVISNLSVSSIGTSSAVILFNTDALSTGKINYGKTTAYGKTDGGHSVLLTNHNHPLSGLTPNTLYNFVVIVRDSYGNETIYENTFFKTLEDSSQTVSTSAPAAGEKISQEETITDETTAEEEVSGGGGGSGVVVQHSYTQAITLPVPKLTKVEALDGQAMFIWTPQKHPKATPGSTQIRTNIIIVRNPVRYSDNPTFGQIVYKGNSGLFTDTKLENGKTYYYSIFTVNQFKSYSQAARFKVILQNVIRETKLEVVPAVVQKNPIYVFPRALKIGDKNKHVGHLQVLLASEPSLYPRGFVTGYFGPLTKEAVVKFQKRYKLSATGVAGMATLKKLEQLSSIEISRNKADMYDKALARDLTVGHTGGDVSVLQQFLINANVYPEALVTGYFGSLTKAAVARFQRQQNISPAYGYFGPITKKRMLNLIRLRSVSF